MPTINLIQSTVIVLALSSNLAFVHAEIKRTHTGKPDLSGTYDTGTLTPLNRPKEFGDKQFMTTEEAEKIQQQMAARYDIFNRESSADRKAPVKGGDGNNTAGAGGVGGYNAFWVDPGSDIFEIDGKFRTSILYAPKNGQQPKMKAAALMRSAAIYESFRHDNDGTASWLARKGPGPFDGPESLAPSERCLISFAATIPTIPSLYNNYKRIIQTDEHVMILQEMVHDARIIRIDSEHTSAKNRKSLGDSIAYWEGDVLVVETKHFKVPNGLFGADENLTVTERFSRMESGDLLYDFTVKDPTVWEKAWSGEYVWSANNSKVYEYACHEGNYAMGNILRGARLLESEWEGERK